MEAISYFLQSGLQLPDLENIYHMCDKNGDGSLDENEFTVAIHIVMTCRMVL